MDLELRHLKVIRAIADAGSLTAAATALGLAQPALSTQLKRIERTLGGELFERGRLGVRPTALGELVVARAAFLLPTVQELQEEAVRFAQGRHHRGVSRFRLGGTHGPLLGGLVDRLAAAYPDTPVTTRTSWSERELAAWVVQGRADFALVGVCRESPPPAADRLVWREIGVDPVFVMLAETHPLAARTQVALGELAGEAWAVVPGDGCFGDCFAAACAREGFAPSRLYETDTASCVHLVRVGRAVGLCRATFPTTPGMVTRPLAGAPLRWRHVVGWHGDAPGAAVAREVVAAARGAHGAAVADSATYAAWRAAHPGFAEPLPA